MLSRYFRAFHSQKRPITGRVDDSSGMLMAASEVIYSLLLPDLDCFFNIPVKQFSSVCYQCWDARSFSRQPSVAGLLV